MRRTVFSAIVVLSFFFAVSVGQAEPVEEEAEKVLSGMSILGNDDAPKSLVIVPWKSSKLGDTLEVSRALDGGRQPVDRDVFGRALEYYEIRTGWNDQSGIAAR